ncbi:lipopolysaccharide biosynthesis protein [Bifidobacterium aerophilum]|uniref:Oligosaccharide flippase family protein n=1 Tax=Bifidobacterium aerophilum TaxID=1798155 RepID=A0A6N9Z5P7_9BIFI|nr:lipopolysaccharide biosynthesis protein [Bifidobacterium aerophilum]NEG89720.1 oligosaccharide flippase family protein [Bifidobacterium aerophilum]
MVSQRRAGAILGYLNVLAKNLVNLLYVPLLLHFLGQGDYGVFQMTNSVVFALALLSAGFYGSYVRFYMRERTHGDEQGIRRLNGIFLLVYIVVACACLVCGLLLVMNVHALFSGGLTDREVGLARELLMIMSVNVAAQLMSTPFDSYVVAHERFAFQQTRQLFTTLAMPLLAILLLYAGMGAVGVACAQLSVSLVLLFLNIRYAVFSLNMRFMFTGLQWNMFKAIAMFSFWIFLNQIVDIVNNNVPNFLLGAMASSSVVATFAIALQIRNIFFSMSTTMSNVFVPQINRIVAEHDDNDRLTKLMTRIGRYQMILFWFIFGGFVVVGQNFVRIWAGDANSDAYWLSLVMTLPVMIPLTQTTGIEIQRAKNRHKARSLIYLLAAVIDIVISVLLIPSTGYWATAWGYTVSILFGTGLFMNWYYHCRIGLDMGYFWKTMMPTIITSIGVIAICWFIVHVAVLPDLASLLVYGIVYCIVYAVAAWLFIARKQERGIIQDRLHRRMLRK